MNSKRQTILWISLFAAIIIVPTLCLLWFMGQAVRNERLSTREKIITLYRQRVQRFDWNLQSFVTPNAEKLLAPTIDHIVQGLQEKPIDGLIIVENKSVLYPQNRVVTPPSLTQDSLWQIEYVKKDYKDAARAYAQLTNSATNAEDSLQNLMASARCHKKAGDTTNAIKSYETIINHIPLSDSTVQGAYARVALAKLYVAKAQAKTDSLLTTLFSNHSYSIPSNTRQFILRSAISILLSRDSFQTKDSLITALRKNLSSELLSMQYAPLLTEEELLDTMEERKIYQRDSLYFHTIGQKEKRAIILFKKSSIPTYISILAKEFNEPSIEIHCIDESGQQCGNRPTNKLLLTSLPSLQTEHGNYTLEFYLDEQSTLSSELKNQRATYLWIGMLSVLFIFICGSTAGYFFIHHSNLNKLKNTFLATVTHELKTPIASCRILVDTLLDKKVTDPEKVFEYYTIISQENQRLGRLVDNFLTFSRMERNKQTFQRNNCQLSEIVHTALESMSVKFRNPRCTFSTHLPNEPLTLYVNFDALVTVLTNLLDNAYKYSGSEKEIELTVKLSETAVTILVSDNGIGIAKKDQKKVFQKFYQVDQNLNRKREGCGLGLSIVHYIVTAHLGTIAVSSEEGRGTTFTITLPI